MNNAQRIVLYTTIIIMAFVGSSSSSSSKTCKYTQNGVYVCSKTATKGDLCTTHYNYLDSIYKSFTE